MGTIKIILIEKIQNLNWNWLFAFSLINDSITSLIYCRSIMINLITEQEMNAICQTLALLRNSEITDELSEET